MGIYQARGEEEVPGEQWKDLIARLNHSPAHFTVRKVQFDAERRIGPCKRCFQPGEDDLPRILARKEGRGFPGSCIGWQDP